MLSFRTGRRDREAAERLYAPIIAAARRPAFYTRLGVPDTLQGRFEMISLHLFAVLHRLMHDPGDDVELARRLAERFVDDMDASFREMGVGDLTVPKRMTALYRSFGGRVSAYKAGMESGRAELAAAIARNVFPDESEGGHATALAEYLAAAIAILRDVDLARLRQGDIRFPEISPALEAWSP